MNDREDPGWSRSEWARWWIDHDEVDEAARVLEAGDELPVGKADFRDLAAALARRGLTALYEEGCAFVHTQAEAHTLIAQAAQEVSKSGIASDRRPPARALAPRPEAQAKKTA